MSRATPQMRHFAKLLIVCDRNGTKSGKSRIQDPFSDCEKLRLPLSTLMGNEGYQALLLHTQALAGKEVPWLRTVQVKADGTWEGLEGGLAQLDPDELFEGRVVLLARMLGLLVAFIGENLTLGLVQGVWPKAPLNNLGLVKGLNNQSWDKNE